MMVLRSRANASWQRTLYGWVLMSRIPFQTVGVMPFLLGTLLALRMFKTFSLQVFLWGILAVVMIMLSTYFAGEYYDEEVDRLSARMEKNRFSGGSQAIVKGLIPRHHARVASRVALVIAGLIGLLLQFYYKTGHWTIPLGLAGMIAGFFYSTEPFRWVKRGIGEIMIGFCYGWLPVAASFYLQSGTIPPLIHWVSLPIVFSIFNVILINEFPDYPADIRSDKANLVIRIGKPAAARLYAAAGVATLLTYPFAVIACLPPLAHIFYPPLLALSLYPIVGMVRGAWAYRDRLERMCGVSIIINLFIPASYILILWFRSS